MRLKTIDAQIILLGFVCALRTVCVCLFVNGRSPRKMPVSMKWLWRTTEAKTHQPSISLTMVTYFFDKKNLPNFFWFIQKNIKPACSFVNVCSLFVGFKDLMNEVFSVIGKKCIFNMSYWRSVFTVYHHLDTVIRVTRWRSVCSANSSTPLKIQSTEEGIRLYSFVSYYNDELHVTWHHKWDSLFPNMKICCAICFKNKSWLGRKYNLSKITHS